jgi:hypothetical protein
MVNIVSFCRSHLYDFVGRKAKVTQSLIVDLEGLFLAVRLHARKTMDLEEEDPNPPPGFITRRDMTQSIGTLKLPHLHATLRGNGRVSFTNPRKGRLRMGYAAVGARSARDE